MAEWLKASLSKSDRPLRVSRVQIPPSPKMKVMPITKIPENFFRVSAKAIVVKDDKILLVQEPDGRWELPGGGIDASETIEQALKRELKEELDASISKIAKKPLYIWTQEREKKGVKYNCLFLGYEVKVKSLKFKKTKEAIKAEFFTKKDMQKLNLHINLTKFKKLYNPKDLLF